MTPEAEPERRRQELIEIYRYAAELFEWNMHEDLVPVYLPEAQTEIMLPAPDAEPYVREVFESVVAEASVDLTGMSLDGKRLTLPDLDLHRLLMQVLASLVLAEDWEDRLAIIKKTYWRLGHEVCTENMETPSDAIEHFAMCHIRTLWGTDFNSPPKLTNPEPEPIKRVRPARPPGPESDLSRRVWALYTSCIASHPKNLQTDRRNVVTFAAELEDLADTHPPIVPLMDVAFQQAYKYGAYSIAPVKMNLYRLAESIGIPCPGSWAPKDGKP